MYSKCGLQKELLIWQRRSEFFLLGFMFIDEYQGWCNSVFWDKPPSREVAEGHRELCNQGLLCNVGVRAWK